MNLAARNPAEGQRLYDHIRTIAFVLDAITALSPALKDSPVHVGIEPIIAASLPLAGPLVGAALSFYVVLLSILFDIRSDTIAWMVRSSLMDMTVTYYRLFHQLFNIMIDVFAGWIPLVGPILDVTFKVRLLGVQILFPNLTLALQCNLANLALLEGHLKRSKWAVLVIPPPTRWFGALGDALSGRSTRKSRPV